MFSSTIRETTCSLPRYFDNWVNCFHEYCITDKLSSPVMPWQQHVHAARLRQQTTTFFQFLKRQLYQFQSNSTQNRIMKLFIFRNSHGKLRTCSFVLQCKTKTWHPRLTDIDSSNEKKNPNHWLTTDIISRLADRPWKYFEQLTCTSFHLL